METGTGRGPSSSSSVARRLSHTTPAAVTPARVTAHRARSSSSSLARRSASAARPPHTQHPAPVTPARVTAAGRGRRAAVWREGGLLPHARPVHVRGARGAARPGAAAAADVPRGDGRDQPPVVRRVPQHRARRPALCTVLHGACFLSVRCACACACVCVCVCVDVCRACIFVPFFMVRAFECVLRVRVPLDVCRACVIDAGERAPAHEHTHAQHTHTHDTHDTHDTHTPCHRARRPSTSSAA